ncbi:Mss4p nuclear export [Dimargaris cristalligena]|uniref:Protein BCP1 n=1 Tax=Dimargaris cristalligena TaxID=215637 RepID=A0A4Q0A4A1_9FUNG|nr:Mss4p nuclear export [Dimargaris cristalligena]RKP40401.1 p21-C-terminal region-binding protein-domain-containing protein [Dimargaris cristalligena]|eukprot:RKP40401.1 p21-C-terminal region-binding protein-domain-containing protein [Dimargaris cristalligena]
MSKRIRDDADLPPSDEDEEMASSGSGSSEGDESDPDMKETVDVDFEFFDPKEGDFHTIKRLLSQLFVEDSEKMDISGMTELIIQQPLIGTCVKVENDGDPYALLTVLNMQQHAEQNAIKKLRNYLLHKARSSPKAKDLLSKLLDPASKKAVGFVLSERLVNVPPQITPPMFRMLAEEIQWAVEDKEPYEFEYYILISKTYRQVESSLDVDDEEETPAAKSAKDKGRKKGRFADAVFYMQPEEEFVEQFAQISFDFRLSKESGVSDSKRTFNEFGIAPSRRCFIIAKDKMEEFVKGLESFVLG